MKDERERFGRVVRGFSPPEDAFERLLRRRDRAQRNRRVRAGALGVFVALAVGFVLLRAVTSDRVPVDQPTPKPAPAAAGTLAYVLDGDVYVADPGGSNVVKIADGLSDCDGASDGKSYWAEGPMWSPDGRYLAYRSSDCSNTEHWRDVVISDSVGDVVATFPAQGWDIAWSPDSTRVAVWEWDALFETIGIYGVDGARQAQLTMAPGWAPTGDHDPEWVPGGTSLMVDNMEVPLDGDTRAQLALPADAFSPDGSHVIYVKGTTGVPIRSLTVGRSDGSDPQVVFDDWVGSPTWSPTGDQIAFTASGRGPASYSAELRVFDLTTGSVTLLTEGELGARLEVIGFSPRGDRILFSKSGSVEVSLWSIGIDGSDPRLVVAGTRQGQWFSPR